MPSEIGRSLEYQINYTAYTRLSSLFPFVSECSVDYSFLYDSRIDAESTVRVTRGNIT